jgi:hypothetical protein
MKYEYNNLAGKPAAKSPLGKRKPIWGNNIKIYLQVVGCEVVDYIHLNQERDHRRFSVNTVMELLVP